MKLLQIVEPFHRRWSKRDSFPGLHSDSRHSTPLCTVFLTSFDFLTLNTVLQYVVLYS